MAEWTPAVGDKVAIFTARNFSSTGGEASIEFTEVTKIGKRDVVLANGERFNLKSLSKSHGTWSPTTYLLPADHPRVQQARWANTSSRLYNKASAAFDTWRQNRSVEGAKVLIEVVQAWINHEEKDH